NTSVLHHVMSQAACEIGHPVVMAAIAKESLASVVRLAPELLSEDQRLTIVQAYLAEQVLEKAKEMEQGSRVAGSNRLAQLTVVNAGVRFRTNFSRGYNRTDLESTIPAEIDQVFTGK